MTPLPKRVSLILFLGDILIFVISLWLTLSIRYLEIPTANIWALHVIPFSILFIVWLLVFFIAGLYEKRSAILRHRLPGTIFRAQIVNTVVAVLFFYFIPYFGITPKTNLFIYLIISFVLVLIWRIYISRIVSPKGRQPALLIAGGAEMKELLEEVNAHENYSLKFVSSINLDAYNTIDFQEEIVKRVYAEHISIIVIDLDHEKVSPMLPKLYNLIFSGVVFIDMHKIYEDVFDRIPLSLIKHSWFLENISLAPKTSYDVLKRFMDVVIALPLAILSLLVYPFVALAMLFDEGKGLFSVQERVGKNNSRIKMYKFRTMKIANDGGKWGDKNENHVTRLGEFLRKTRIDEIPQLWNVVLGDISLIGPRPEFPAAVETYEKEISYYGIRHLIKPGLSGWAQIYHDNHPHHGIGVTETKEKLSYDLYYLKNRSFILDLNIALKTINKLLSIAGR